MPRLFPVCEDAQLLRPKHSGEFGSFWMIERLSAEITVVGDGELRLAGRPPGDNVGFAEELGNVAAAGTEIKVIGRTQQGNRVS